MGFLVRSLSIYWVWLSLISCAEIHTAIDYFTMQFNGCRIITLKCSLFGVISESLCLYSLLLSLDLEPRDAKDSILSIVLFYAVSFRIIVCTAIVFGHPTYLCF